MSEIKNLVEFYGLLWNAIILEGKSAKPLEFSFSPINIITLKWLWQFHKREKKGERKKSDEALNRQSFETPTMALSLFGGKRSNVFDPFSLDIWDPFEGFPFNSMVGSAPSSSRDTSAFASTRIDWKETPEAHVFKADLPGLKKEEVKVEVEEGRVLQISGERSREQEEKTDKWHRVERSSGKFLRRFRLPENTKVEQIKASMENGVLTVTVPKEEEKRPEVKSIDISG